MYSFFLGSFEIPKEYLCGFIMLDFDIAMQQITFYFLAKLDFYPSKIVIMPLCNFNKSCNLLLKNLLGDILGLVSYD